ncbi:ABC transporter substrate-binding protein [Spirochaetia bacterium]|nr:ABC transporter substrate-binding protein [Spirochaetia bacterium]
MKGGAGFFIALRYLWGRAREGGRYLRGAAFGIALSLVPIIVTLTVADGMIRGITDRYIELGTGHLRIYDYFDPESVGEALSEVLQTPGLTGVWAEQQSLAVCIGLTGKAGATIRAVEPSFWTDPGSRRFLQVLQGDASLESDNEVLLGEGLAESIGAELGKPIYIMTVHMAEDGSALPETRPFTVRGIISSGYRELDSLWCIMTYSAGANFLSQDISNSFLMAKIDDPYRNADTIAEDLSRSLGSMFDVYTWKDLQRSQYSSYESTRQLLLFIMALIVIVAAVNVSSAASMLVIERQRDIGVLKAAGESPAGIGRIFLWASFLTGLVGGCIGIAAGLLIGVFINPLVHGLEAVLTFFSRLFNGSEVKILDPGYYLENIPVIIDWSAVLLIGLFTLACSIIASSLPAYRAGKLKPLDILRKQ